MGVATLEGIAMKRWLCVLALLMAGTSGSAADAENSESQVVLVVVGTPGTPDYAEAFAKAAEAWAEAADEAEAAYTIIGLETDDASTAEDRAVVQEWLAQASHDGTRPLWFVYIGHGSNDGRETKLNLRGTDVTATELRDWLAPFTRPLVAVLGNSASGPFLPQISGPNRVVITATTSGDEINYARFGTYFSHAVADPAADIDQDGQTSLLEAFVTTAQRVELFYTEAGRMASEHPLLDDNGDKRGTPPDWFNGIRLTKQPEGGGRADGTEAHRISLVENEWERSLTSEQRKLRDELEGELEALRVRKSEMLPDDYLWELEVILRRLSPVYVPEVEQSEETIDELLAFVELALQDS